MNLQHASHRIAFLFAGLALLAGCPAPPELRVSPERISFGKGKDEAKLTIQNAGGGTLDWTIEEVVKTATGDYEAQDIEWLSVDFTSGNTKQEEDTILLTVTREGLPVGKYTDGALRVQSKDGAEVIVPLLLEVESKLETGQAEIYATPGTVETQVKLANTGQQAMLWRIWYLPDPEDMTIVTVFPTGVTALPESGTLEAGRNILVTISWPADYKDTLHFVFDSDSRTPAIEDGSPTVTIGFDAPLKLVPGDKLELSKNMDSAADAKQPATQLEIQNASKSDKSWTAAVLKADGSETGTSFSVTPSNGMLLPNTKVTVEIAIAAPGDVLDGSGNYQFAVTSDNITLATVPINVHVESLPKLAVSWPPAADTTRPEVVPVDALNYGRDKVEQTFYVVNVGGLSSLLNYRITQVQEGEEELNPLVASIHPAEGDTIGEKGVFFHPDAALASTLIDATKVVVAIDRDNLTKDLETRTLLIEALDAGNQPIDPKRVAPIQLTLTAERAPLTLEGATNRARPPFMMRFVFTPRDTFGKAIDTWDNEKLDRLSFSVTEDGALLDLDELGRTPFVRGPRGITANIALMLDFSGSMYYAGALDAQAPLEPGKALEDVRAAALGFIADLPAGWRMALMYHNDRQQDDFMIHPFTQDRESLKAALTAFTLPPPLHGVSPIYDAMIAGIDRLAAMDPGETLPFDDADLRALVIVTDGQDNASVATSSSVDTAAKDNRVRIFPLVYSAGESVDYGPMLTMAANSGGHFFSAGDATKLPALLDNQQGLALEPPEQSAPGKVSFRVANMGAEALTWTANKRKDDTEGESDPWIAEPLAVPGGSILPGAAMPVTLELDAAYLRAQATELGRAISVDGYLDIASDNGSGTVWVAVSVGADGAVDEIKTELRDEPGRIMSDLSRQIVFTYLTPKQQNFKYLIGVSYKDENNRILRGAWERDGVWAGGDVDASQFSLTSEGLVTDGRTGDISATAYLRCDYASRNLYNFQARFYPALPQELLDEAAALEGEWDGQGEAPFPENAIQEFRQIDIAQDLEVAIAENGLLAGGVSSDAPWLLHASDDGIYYALDQQNTPLPYGVSGNLLKITIAGPHLRRFVEILEAQNRDAEILLGMRADNDIYFSPPAPGQPLETHYVVYPGGPTYFGKFLSVARKPSLAAPARAIGDLWVAPDVLAKPAPWDFDEDKLPDFNDPYPDDKARPASLVVPNPAELYVAANATTQKVLSVRNNRLDRFVFGLAPSALPDWATALAIQPLSGLLLPDYSGNSQLPQHRGTITITVDARGRSAQAYPVLLPVTALPAAPNNGEKVDFTLVVTP